MKILRLLNKKYLSIAFILFLIGFNSNAEDQPVDIWNIDKEKIDTKSTNDNLISEDSSESQTSGSSIYNMQSQKELDLVEVDQEFDSNELKIIGLYDPQDYNLKIDMWSNSNGDQLKYLFSNIAKLQLSEDASDLMNVLLFFYNLPHLEQTKVLNLCSHHI